MSIEARFSIQQGAFKLLAEFDLPHGITALFGASGSGKTTLLRAIAGLDKHQASSLVVAGHSWQDNSTFVPPHQRAVGYVFQEASLFKHLNVRQNIEFGFARRGKTADREALQNTIDLMGVSKLLDRSVAQLSGGEKQRVAIARALAAQPELLLMDEPLAALDEAGKQEIFPYLESLHQNLKIPVIYVSHSVSEVARLADHIIVLDQGQVKAQGPASEILTRTDLALAHSNDAGAILDCTVSNVDKEFGLAELNTPAGIVTVINRQLAPSQNIRLHIGARDVSIALSPPQQTSILNVLKASVLTISAENNAQVLLQLQIDQATILARLTRKSAEQLALKAGKVVYAQIKSVALF